MKATPRDDDTFLNDEKGCLFLLNPNVSYGDIVFEERVLRQLISSDEALSITSDSAWQHYWSHRMDDVLSDVESFTTDSEGYVVELGKKANSLEAIQGQYMGLMKIRSDQIPFILDFYQELANKADHGENFDNLYMTDFLQALINRGYPIKAVAVKGGWLEIDTLEDIALCERLAGSKLQSLYADW